MSIDPPAQAAYKVLEAPAYRLWGQGPGGYVYTIERRGRMSLHLYKVGPGEDVSLHDGPVTAVAGSESWVLYSAGKLGLEVVEAHDGSEPQAIAGFRPGRVLSMAIDSKRTSAWAAVAVSSGRGVEVRIINLREARVTGSVGLDVYLRLEAILDGVIYGVVEHSGALGVMDIQEGRLVAVKPPGGGRVKQVRASGSSVTVLVSNIVDEVYRYSLYSGFTEKLDTRQGDLASDKPAEILDHGWGEDGLWMIARGQRTHVYYSGRRIDAKLKGTPRRAAPIPGGLAVEYSSITMPARIILLERGGSRFRARIPRGVDKPKPLLDARVWETHIESGGVVRVPVVVAEPPGAPKPGSTAVYIHEGPWDRVRDEWDPVIALLLLLGYRVVAPNYRGSQGEGRHYADMILGDPGGGDLQDVVEAANWARTVGLSDTLHLVGRGYGGYLALLAALSEPGMFRTASAENPIVDWIEEASKGDAMERSRADALFLGDMELMARRSLTEAGTPRCRLLITASTSKARSLLPYVLHLIESGVDVTLHMERDTRARFILELATFLGKAQDTG